MSETKQRQGKCLCGAVQLTAAKASKHVDACHCSMCRTWSGGPAMSLDCGDEVSLTGQEHIQVYNSSEWGERAFCKQCGTHLYYRLKHNDQHFVPAGLFEDSDDLDFTMQIYIDNKPTYYNFAEKTRTFTEAEFLAMINGGQ